MQMTPQESKLNLLLEILALWHKLLQRIHISQPQEVTLQYEKTPKTKKQQLQNQEHKYKRKQQQQDGTYQT